jgi:hypothetical protein
MNKQQVLKYLKQMLSFMNTEIAIVDDPLDNFTIVMEDAINVRDGLDMAIKFLEKDGKE